nr:hypothetical protein BaRGS_003519 [Batillaria attramentaria]
MHCTNTVRFFLHTFLFARGNSSSGSLSTDFGSPGNLSMDFNFTEHAQGGWRPRDGNNLQYALECMQVSVCTCQ